MTNIMKEAHKLTKAMVEKYGVDYKAQFALNLEYLTELAKEYNDKEIAEKILDDNKAAYKRYNKGFIRKYDGAGDLKRTDIKVWANYGKIRVYYTFNIDNVAVYETYREVC